MENLQVYTAWENNHNERLVTTLRKSTVRKIREGEVLAEMIYVPIHGSFWTATHPYGLHPRINEFMADGYFVFGNGGVGRVLQSRIDQIEPGDYVCIFGHTPCSHSDCYACNVAHRYTECEYNEGKILGHGKQSLDGTYATYAILPEHSFGRCFRKEEKPSEEQLKPYMLGFLFADVRNALTRNPDSLKKNRMLLFGAGYSGQVAAYLHKRALPDSKIFVVDSSATRLENIKAINPGSIKTYCLSSELASKLNKSRDNGSFSQELNDAITAIRDQMRSHFKGKGCNLIFDASSGNTVPIWNSKMIMSPDAHCIPFGFGSDGIHIGKEIFQLSGLNIVMSRGVGNIENRNKVIELIRNEAGGFIKEKMLQRSLKLNGIHEAFDYIYKAHHPPMPLHMIRHAYISFQEAVIP